MHNDISLPVVKHLNMKIKHANMNQHCPKYNIPEAEYLMAGEWKNTLSLCENWLQDESLPRFELK